VVPDVNRDAIYLPDLTPMETTRRLERCAVRFAARDRLHRDADRYTDWRAKAGMRLREIQKAQGLTIARLCKPSSAREPRGRTQQGDSHYEGCPW
jgi:hypothetical protein